ncbi:GNAT family N-acetyltransferase [Isoptericola sediminis]|uniref:GNAT family N-acetyltransferase n=1 Tax=Isoptericola sediminis TaxID=2733572 RepID=A0A849K808_9MICO|nr:GNAT family protein [Isoptericola sediminis]NNU28590.1 GNAT family N-acetyltransferase [Isoptericola sediminis]
MTPDPVLRPLAADDAEAVLAAFRSAPDMARQGDVSTPTEARRYVDRLIDLAGPHRAFAVDDAGTCVGLVTVTVDAVNRSGWFWYWMHADHRGRGLAQRAAATVADWALSDGELERLELGHRVNNPASGAVARAAGFVREGTEREKFLVDGRRVDVAAYGRLRTDPAPSGARLSLFSGVCVPQER